MKRNLILVFLASLVILGLEKVGLFSGLGTLISKPTESLQLAFFATSRGITDRFSTVFEIGNLRDKNAQLEIQLATLQAENGKLSKLEAENKLLRDQLELPATKEVKVIQASVLGYSLASSRGFISIDKGQADSLKGGEIVVLKDVILGKISSVSDSSALVKLLTDSESKYLAETASQVKGVIVGDFGSRMKLTKVLLDDTLTSGDLVYTSGEEGMPKGLVIGKISKVKRLEAELFQEAEVEPMININKLDLVFIRI